MTKDEALRKAQSEIWNKGPFFQTEMAQYAIQLGFDKGVEWALSNQWVSVEDELPPLNKEIVYSALSERVLVRIDFEGNIMHRTACYDYINKRWTVHSEFVTHWMPIPE